MENQNDDAWIDEAIAEFLADEKAQAELAELAEVVDKILNP
jgi:hypothetical protein